MVFPKLSRAERSKARKRAKARERRKESVIGQRARKECVARDGYCRLQNAQHLFGLCSGASEWAHFEEWKRWKTRGMDAEERHRSDRSLMLCDGHHDAYDHHALRVEAMTEDGTDGPLRWTRDRTVYEEPATA
jgi:hypothetical protein